MKKLYLLAMLYAMLLTGCGQHSDVETTTVSQTASAEQTAEHQIAATTAEIPEATAICSDVIPSITTITESSVNTKGTSKDTESITTTTKAPKDEPPAVTNADTEKSVATTKTTTTKAKTTTKVTTTIKPVTTTKTTTTTKSIITKKTTTTPKPQTEPPEDIIEDTTSLQSVLNYVNSLGRTTDEYYNIGAGLGHNGSDYGKAEAVYNWIRGNVSGNCQVFSVATMYACKGVGLECRYAFFSPDAWYGHMANLVCVEGTWYVLDTQGGRFLKSDKYGEITRIFDENDNTIEISISESAY